MAKSGYANRRVWIKEKEFILLTAESSWLKNWTWMEVMSLVPDGVICGLHKGGLYRGTYRSNKENATQGNIQMPALLPQPIKEPTGVPAVYRQVRKNLASFPRF